MNTTFFRCMNWISATIIFAVFILMLMACEADDPIKEDIPELITKITLTFTPVGAGPAVIVTASDPDGDGVQDIMVDGAVNLAANTNYTLALSLINELAEQTSPEYDLTNEIEEEGDEHMFFYGWTNSVFADPLGDGNIDDRGDVINYEDEDETGLPIGITTAWTSGTLSSGTFRLVLKHQPGLKTITSDVEVGETDLDVVFDIVVN